MTQKPPLEQLQILVIDDEAEICRAAQLQLEGEGFAVSCAMTAADARRMINENQPQAILLDIHLGSESGLEILDEIRACGDTRPVIVISVLDQLDVKLDAVRRGCDAYFAKPLDWDALLRKLRQLAGPPARSQRWRVLVADDDEDQSALLLATLKDGGYDAEVCPSAAAFETALSHRPPDLVLLATELPDASGYDIARYLRQNERFAATPIVFLATASSNASQVEVIAAGGDDLLRKPVPGPLLLASTGAHLDRATRWQRSAMRETAGTLNDPAAIARSAAFVDRKREHPERSYACALLQIDYLGTIKEHYGHLAGSRVLASLSGSLKRRFPQCDVIGSDRGEELAVFLEASEPEANRIILEIQEEFSGLTFYGGNEAAFSATFSAGVAGLHAGTTAREWRILADRALQEGRRTVKEAAFVRPPMLHEVFDPRVLDPLIQLQERSGVPIVAEIRELFLSALPGRIEILRNAVASGDSKSAEQAAHAFRGAAGNLGAVRLCALCAQIELTTRSNDFEHAGRLVPELIDESERVAAALRSV